MTNIKTVLATFKVTGLGFPAIQDLGKYSLGDEAEVVVSTLSPSILKEQGITSYFAPQFERGQVFKTAEEIIEANVPLNYYTIKDVDSTDESLEIVVVSRHQGTVDMLMQGLSGDTVVLTGNVSKEDIEGKYVIGTLPPHLVAECALYTPVAIKDFDYNKDGDLQGEELKERIQIGKPISLKEEYHSLPTLESLDDIRNYFFESTTGAMSFSDVDEESCFYYEKQEVELGDGIYVDVNLRETVEMFGYDTQVASFDNLGLSVLSLTKDNKTMLLKTKQ